MLVNTGISYPEEENGKKNLKVATTVPPKLYEYVKSQTEIHGSMSAYLRYLILIDLNGEKIPTKQTQTQQIPPTNPPSVPSRNNSPSTSAAMGYASLHNQIMAELKTKIKRID
ncbi:MAG: hypothetical protein ACETWM_08115 [Candidatus Lokiarchaeia archaeon]